MAEFKYQKIINSTIEGIHSGAISGKLVSIRKYAKLHQIGISTVTLAYQELERMGWIQAEPKRGYFVSPKPKQHQPPNYGCKVNRVKAGQELATAVQFSFNDPDILPLSCTAPSSVLDHELLLNRLHRKVLKHRPYKLMMQDPIEGITELRQEICRHLFKAGQSFSPDQLLMTNGRHEGLLIALTSVKAHHQAIAIETPISFYFQSILKQLDIDVIEVPIQADYQQELSLLSQAHDELGFNTYLVNPNFGDPTGRVLCDEDKISLIQWAERRQVTIIEYDRGELCFNNARPNTLASLAQHNSHSLQLISIGDFYDTVSPSMGLGYLICINTLDTCVLTKQIVAEEPSMSLQHMLLELMRNGGYFKLINKLNNQLRLQYTQTQALLAPLAELGVYMSQPQGGPCIWLQLPPPCSSTVLWQRVIDAKLSIAPGTMFSFEQNYEAFFRITFALPWELGMEAGLKQLVNIIAEYIQEPAAKKAQAPAIK